MSSDPYLPAVTAIDAHERHWATAAHLCGLLWLLGGGSLIFPPFGALSLLTMLGPLIIWKTKGETSAFIAAQAKEALNFQLTVFLLGLAGLVLALVLVGILLLWVLGVVNLVLVLIAAIQVSDGKAYRYPFSIRLFS